MAEQDAGNEPPPNNAPKPRWAKVFGAGDIPDDWPVIYAVAADDGGCVIAGTFRRRRSATNPSVYLGALDFGGGDLGPDATTLASYADGTSYLYGFVARFDPNGNNVWSARIGNGNDNADVYGVSVAADGTIYVALDALKSFTGAGSGGFLVTYSKTGQRQQTRLVYPNGQLTGVKAYPTGGAIAYGKTPNARTGVWNWSVTRYDASFNVLWTRGAPADGSWSTTTDVEFDQAGDVLAAGWFSNTNDFGNGPVSAQNAQDGFLLKLTAAGAYVWSRTFGSSWDEQIFDLALDAQGSSYVVGALAKPIDFGAGKVEGTYLAKFDSKGTTAWTRQLAPGPSYEFTGAAVDRVTSEAYIVGRLGIGESFLDPSSKPTGAGSGTALAKFSANGDPVWSRLVNTSETQLQRYYGSLEFVRVHPAPGGGVYVSGQFTGVFDPGLGAPVSTGPNARLFLARFDAN